MGKILTDYTNLSDKDKKEYMQSIKKLYIILGLATIFFYVIPFVILFMGDWGKVLFPMLLINVNTIFAFMACFLHSRKHDFSILVPSAIAIFFIPTVVIFLRDYHYVIFALMYFVLGLFGEFTGHLFLRRKKSKRQPLGLNKLVKGQKKREEKKNAAAKRASTGKKRKK